MKPYDKGPIRKEMEAFYHHKWPHTPFKKSAMIKIKKIIHHHRYLIEMLEKNGFEIIHLAE